MIQIFQNKSIKESNITAVFIDISGFTQFSLNNKPRSVYKMLEEFYKIVELETINNNGSLTEIVGDEAVCHFNNVDNAFKTALNLQNKLSEFKNKYKVNFRTSINDGLAINTTIKAHKSKFKVVTGIIQILGERLLKLGKKGSIVMPLSTAKKIKEIDLNNLEIKQSKIKGFGDKVIDYIELNVEYLDNI